MCLESRLGGMGLGLMLGVMQGAGQSVFGSFVGTVAHGGRIRIGSAFGLSLVLLSRRAGEVIPTSRVMAAGEQTWPE